MTVVEEVETAVDPDVVLGHCEERDWKEVEQINFIVRDFIYLFVY
jgi:hypothetical protein